MSAHKIRVKGSGQKRGRQETGKIKRAERQKASDCAKGRERKMVNDKGRNEQRARKNKKKHGNDRRNRNENEKERTHLVANKKEWIPGQDDGKEM